MAGAGAFDALAHQVIECNGRTMQAGGLDASFSGSQNLLDCAEEAIGVVDHQAVKLATLSLIHLAALQSLQVKADGCNGRLQFVSDRIDEAVVLLVATNFAD